MISWSIKTFGMLIFIGLFAGIGNASESSTALVLSTDEQAWIAAHPIIHIQMSDSSPPFEFKENGEWKGMAYDVLVEAAARIGLRVKPMEISWSKALDSIQTDHQVDLLLAVTRSPEREQQMALTATYLSFPQVVFADKRHPFLGGIADLARSRIAVENEYVMVDWLKRDLPQATLLVTPDSGAALTAVSSGTAEAYIGNLAVGSWLIDHQGLTNLAVVAPTDYGDEEFAMGVRRDWPELVQLLNRAIATIPPEDMRAIRQRWLSVRFEHGLRVRDIAAWVLAVAAIGLAFIVQLRRMVNRRTRELKREVELRRAKEHHLEQAQRIAHIGSWSEDLAGNLLWSAETQRIIAWPSTAAAHQTTLMNMVHPDDLAVRRERHALAWARTDAVDLEFRIRLSDGSQRHVQESCQAVLNDQGLVIGLNGVVRDITQRKLAESERAELQRNLLHSEKMRVLGQLAGGIAHDFNNLLGAIIGHAELLLLSFKQPHASPEKRKLYTERILLAASRAAGISTQLRVFSRRDHVTVVPVDVHPLIHEACELARRGATEAMVIELQMTATTATVLGDASQIETALVNLALNSRDAMPEGGTLSFRTTLATLQGPISGAHSFDLVPGAYLEIAVADTGMGMDAAVQSRLFESFFTTKEAGRGTGLGLANVYACVKHHHGAIAIDSTVGKGTTVRIWLPLAHTAAKEPSVTMISGTGTILVVDDDLELRTVAADMLTMLGYQCTVASNGQEAVSKLATQSFDLVLLDMMMPKLNGQQTIPSLRQINGQVRILMCSGSIEDEDTARRYGADGFIPKPYQMAVLSQAVASLLRSVR
jgi:two-component system cell cycle sensor histidine kinase/response regulator CckA